MKTKTQCVYQEALNMFARENTDPTLVFDKGSVAASQRDFTVSAAPKYVREAYLRKAEKYVEATARSKHRAADAPKGQRDGDRGLVKSAEHWKAYLEI